MNGGGTIPCRTHEIPIGTVPNWANSRPRHARRMVSNRSGAPRSRVICRLFASGTRSGRRALLASCRLWKWSPQTATPGLRARGISRHYGDDVTALDGVDLDAEPGRVHGLAP